MCSVVLPTISLIYVISALVEDVVETKTEWSYSCKLIYVNIKVVYMIVRGKHVLFLYK